MPSLALGLGLRRQKGRGGSAAPGVAPENTGLPAFLQPDGLGDFEPADAIDTNENLFLDAGTWTGGTAPYTFDYAIYDAADDSVIMARTNEPDVDLGTMTGLTIYGRVWCIDAALNETSADTADFGPIAAGFVPVVLAAINFRSTDPTGNPADEPVAPATFALASDTHPTTRGGFTFGAAAGAPTASNRTTSADQRLRGFLSFATGTARYRIDLAGGYTGPVKIKISMSVTNASGTPQLGIWDGDPATGTLIAQWLGTPSYANGETVDATGAVKTLATWVAENGGLELAATVTSGQIWLRRATGSGSALINHIYVESAA
jgi:hypothetical protein